MTTLQEYLRANPQGLRELRELKRVSQRELAVRLDVDQTTLSTHERGTIRDEASRIQMIGRYIESLGEGVKVIAMEGLTL